MNLADVRAIISGSTGGLGKELTLQLLRSGAWIYAGDVNVAGLRALRAEAAELPGRLFLESLDITDEASIDAFTKQACATMGTINTLINCAGILRDGFLVSRSTGGEIHKMTTAQWKRVIEVNLTGAFYLAREVASIMVNRKAEGVIINISSIFHSGNAGQGNYSASKAAINAASRSWALELAPHGIRVGVIAPGVIDTQFLGGISDQAQEKLIRAIPLGRVGTPYDIWLAARFIIECEFFTGRVLEVDGGLHLDLIV
jgi:3-oxoacyl-[acyl-carrier protein] reductase